MKSRCGNSHDAAFAYYGGRGIGVCAEWAAAFVAFRDWAVASGYADGLELDRIDNDKGYFPENCRWATRTEQMRNQRKRSDAKTSLFKGVSRCRKKWRVQLTAPGRRSHVAVVDDEMEAARTYDREARAVFGEFAHTNFKD